MCVIAQLVEGAEAKAYYGLAVNYRALEALVDRLLVKETLSGNEVPSRAPGMAPFCIRLHQQCGSDSKHSILYVAEHNMGEHAHATAPWRACRRWGWRLALLVALLGCQAAESWRGWQLLLEAGLLECSIVLSAARFGPAADPAILVVECGAGAGGGAGGGLEALPGPLHRGLQV